jgi:hypothetical protein
MYFPPEIWAGSGPIEERLLFKAGLILEERYLKGTGYSNLVNLQRRDITRIHQASNWDRPACFSEGLGNVLLLIVGRMRIE